MCRGASPRARARMARQAPAPLPRTHSSVQARACERHDHVRQGQNRVVGRGRLLLEHVEPGPGDPAAGERRVEGALVHDRPAGGVDQVSPRLHQPELRRADQVVRLARQRAVDRDEVALAQQRVQVDQRHPGGGVRRHGVGVVRQDAHLERRHQPHHVAPDVADPDQAERPAGHAGAEATAGPVPVAGAGEPVLRHDLSGQREQEREHGLRHRPAHPVRRDRDQHAGAGARLDVDPVVAHPEPRDQGQPPVGPGDRHGRVARAQRQDGVVARREIGRDLGHVLGEILPGDPGRRVEQREGVSGQCGFAVAIQEVASQADAEFLVHSGAGYTARPPPAPAGPRRPRPRVGVAGMPPPLSAGPAAPRERAAERPP